MKSTRTSFTTTFLLALMFNQVSFAADEPSSSELWEPAGTYGKRLTDEQTTATDYLSVHPSGTLWALGGKSILGAGQGIWPFGGDGVQSIFYGAMEAAGTTKNSNGYSAGLGAGYRRIINNSFLLGSYAFFDYNRSPSGHNLWVANPGIEALSYLWDFRLNGYFPTTDQYWLGGEKTAESIGISNFETFHLHGKYDHIFSWYEESNPGVDFEIGRLLPIPKTHGLRAYIGGYHFSMKHTDSLTGAEGRIVLPLTKNISLEARDSYDKVRGNTFMGGFRVSFGGYALEDRDSLGIAGRLSEPVEHNLANFSQGNSVYIGKQFIDKGAEFQVSGNIWFVSPNSATSTGDGTYENPFTALDKDAAKIMKNDPADSQNAQFYIAGPGTYTIGGDDWLWPLFSGSGVYGRTQDFKKGVQYNYQPVLIGGFKTIGNNILQSVNIQQPNAGQAALFMDTANNVTLNSVKIQSTNPGSNGAVYISNSSHVDFEDVTLTVTEANTAAYGINIVNNSHDITINNSDIAVDGAYAEQASGMELYGIKITDCPKVGDNMAVGVYGTTLKIGQDSGLNTYTNGAYGISASNSAFKVVNSSQKTSSLSANGHLGDASVIAANNSSFVTDSSNTFTATGANTNAILLQNQSTMTVQGTNNNFSANSNSGSAYGIQIASGSSAVFDVGGNTIAASNSNGSAYGVSVDGAGSKFQFTTNGNTINSTATAGTAYGINVSNSAAAYINNSPTSLVNGSKSHGLFDWLGINALRIGDAEHTTINADASNGNIYGLNANSATSNLLNAVFNLGQNSNTPNNAYGIYAQASTISLAGSDAFNITNRNGSAQSIGIYLSGASNNFTLGGSLNSVTINAAGNATGMQIDNGANMNLSGPLELDVDSTTRTAKGINVIGSTVDLTPDQLIFKIGLNSNPTQAYGLYADGSVITLEQGSSFTASVNSSAAYGLFATNASSITLNGDNNITITGSGNSTVAGIALDGAKSQLTINKGNQGNTLSVASSGSGDALGIAAQNGATNNGQNVAGSMTLNIDSQGGTVTGIGINSGANIQIDPTLMAFNLGTQTQLKPADAYGFYVDSTHGSSAVTLLKTLKIVTTGSSDVYGVYSTGTGSTITLNDNTIDISGSANNITGILLDGKSQLNLSGSPTLTLNNGNGNATGIALTNGAQSAIGGQLGITVNASGGNATGLSASGNSKLTLNSAQISVSSNSTNVSGITLDSSTLTIASGSSNNTLTVTNSNQASGSNATGIAITNGSTFISGQLTVNADASGVITGLSAGNKSSVVIGPANPIIFNLGSKTAAPSTIYGLYADSSAINFADPSTGATTVNINVYNSTTACGIYATNNGSINFRGSDTINVTGTKVGSDSVSIGVAISGIALSDSGKLTIAGNNNTVNVTTDCVKANSIAAGVNIINTNSLNISQPSGSGNLTVNTDTSVANQGTVANIAFTNDNATSGITYAAPNYVTLYAGTASQKPANVYEIYANNSNLTINSLISDTATNNIYGVYAANGSIVNFGSSAGSIKVASTGSGSAYGIYSNGSTVNINNGTLEIDADSKSGAIYGIDYDKNTATSTLSNLTVNAGNGKTGTTSSNPSVVYGIYASGGSVTLSGNDAITVNNAGSSATNNAVAVYLKSADNSISGGSNIFKATSNVGNAIGYQLVSAPSSASINITGGLEIDADSTSGAIDGMSISGSTLSSISTLTLNAGKNSVSPGEIHGIDLSSSTISNISGLTLTAGAGTGSAAASKVYGIYANGGSATLTGSDSVTVNNAGSGNAIGAYFTGSTGNSLTTSNTSNVFTVTSNSGTAIGIQAANATVSSVSFATDPNSQIKVNSTSGDIHGIDLSSSTVTSISGLALNVGANTAGTYTKNVYGIYANGGSVELDGSDAITVTNNGSGKAVGVYFTGTTTNKLTTTKTGNVFNVTSNTGNAMGVQADNANAIDNKISFAADSTGTSGINVDSSISSSSSSIYGMNINSSSTSSLSVSGLKLNVGTKSQSTGIANVYGIYASSGGVTLNGNNNITATNQYSGSTTGYNAYALYVTSANAAATISSTNNSMTASAGSKGSAYGIDALNSTVNVSGGINITANSNYAYGVFVDTGSTLNLNDGSTLAVTGSGSTNIRGITLQGSGKLNVAGNSTLNVVGGSGIASGISVLNATAYNVQGSSGKLLTVNVDSNGGTAAELEFSNSKVTTYTPLAYIAFNAGQSSQYIPTNIYGVYANSNSELTIYSGNFTVNNTAHPTSNVYAIYANGGKLTIENADGHGSGITVDAESSGTGSATAIYGTNGTALLIIPCGLVGQPVTFNFTANSHQDARGIDCEQCKSIYIDDSGFGNTNINVTGTTHVDGVKAVFTGVTPSFDMLRLANIDNIKVNGGSSESRGIDVEGLNLSDVKTKALTISVANITVSAGAVNGEAVALIYDTNLNSDNSNIRALNYIVTTAGKTAYGVHGISTSASDPGSWISGNFGGEIQSTNQRVFE